MLEVEALHCGYGALRAVQDLSLRVEAGRITALLGPNGAGKSSTVMAIAGHVALSAGDVRLDGESIAAASPVERTRRGIGLVPEGRRVFADLSVAENLLVGATCTDAMRRAPASRACSRSFPRLAERYRQRAGTLSGGEQQMLAIGRALMADPKVLLIDELSLGLMPAIVDQCFAAILESRSRRRGGAARGAEHAACPGARRLGGGAGVRAHRLPGDGRGVSPRHRARRLLLGSWREAG